MEIQSIMSVVHVRFDANKFAYEYMAVALGFNWE